MDWMDNINRQSTSRLCGHIYKNYIKENVVCLLSLFCLNGHVTTII